MNPPPPPPPPNLSELMQMMVENHRLLTASIGWQTRVVRMHRMGQHLISIVASRISWILSPHLLERLKNPFKLRSG